MDWDWPPIEELDQDTYTVELSASAAVLRSPESSELGVRVEKRFEPLASARAIRVTYSIVNVSDMRCCIWAICCAYHA